MATSEISEGCLYAVVFREGSSNFVRFIESGIYNGFFESKGENYLHLFTLIHTIYRRV